ncbi:unnamed protein product [Rotaria sp. Silwood2]|nr:unnamed protein product [Rotaria sp. Silwood2]
MFAYTRTPSGYHAKILQQALDKKPIDYITLIRIIIGHEVKDLCEIKLEYSKMYDETLYQSIEDRMDIAERKNLLAMIVVIGKHLTSNDSEEVCSDDRDNSSSTRTALRSITSRVAEIKANCSLHAFEKFIQILKIRHSH